MAASDNFCPKVFWKNLKFWYSYHTTGSTLFQTLLCLSKFDRSVCHFFVFILGFPRDGTSRGTSRDKPGRDVPLSLCPGTKIFSCPVVPLSRDKGRSKCPGTKPSVPGRPAGQNGQKMAKKWPKLAKKNFF